MKLLPLVPPSKVRGLFWTPDRAFVQDLADSLAGKRVLEIFAGNAYLAALMAEQGVSVTATSVLSGMDAHSEGVYHPVEEINAVRAVLKHKDDHDVLMMAWPTTTDQAFVAAMHWGCDKPIVFIGETTDYALGQLGGCATDEFFEHFHVNKIFESYKGNMVEKACMGKMGPPRPEFAAGRNEWENSRKTERKLRP